MMKHASCHDLQVLHVSLQLLDLFLVTLEALIVGRARLPV